MAYLLKLGDYTFPKTWYPADRTLGVSVPAAKLARTHGARLLTGYLGATRLVIRGGLLGPGEPIGGQSNLRTAVDALRAALMDTPANLYFGESDRYYRNVQCENEAEAFEATFWDRILQGSDLALVTGDPYRYAEAASVDGTWTSVVSGETHQTTVGGNASAAPQITFTPSGVGSQEIEWTFSNDTTSQTFTLDGSVTGGSAVVIDCLALTCTSAGASAPTLFDGEFVRLVTGGNVLKLTMTSGGCSAIQIDWRNRWW